MFDRTWRGRRESGKCNNNMKEMGGACWEQKFEAGDSKIHRKRPSYAIGSLITYLSKFQSFPWTLKIPLWSLKRTVDGLETRRLLRVVSARSFRGLGLWRILTFCGRPTIMGSPTKNARQKKRAERNRSAQKTCCHNNRHSKQKGSVSDLPFGIDHC